MIVQMVDNIIIVDKKQEYLIAAKDFMEDSRCHDLGCLEAEVYTNPELPEHVYMISKWETRADMEHCLASGSFTRHMAELSKAFVSNQDTILETV